MKTTKKNRTAAWLLGSVFFIIFQLSTFQSLAQPINFEWVRTFGSNGKTTSSVAMKLYGDKELITAGHFYDKIDFDAGSGIFHQTSNGNQDVFVIKYDTSGNFLWAKQFGGEWDDYVKDIAVDKDGNIIILGLFQSTVDMDPGPGIVNFTAGSANSFVVKLDKDGNYIWARQFNLHNMSTIDTDAAGNIITGGTFAGTRDFDPGPATYTGSTVGRPGNDLFLVKLDPGGNFTWMRQMPNKGGSEQQLHGLKTDAANNIFLAGSFTGIIDCDPGSSEKTITSSGNDDAFVLTLDQQGNFRWAKSWGGPGGDKALGLAIDLKGNVYTTGQFLQQVDFDPGTTAFTLSTTSIYYSAFILKLDHHGNFVYVKTLQGGDSYGNSITLDKNENVYVAGAYHGTVDFDPGTSSFYLSKGHLFALKLEAGGDFAWSAGFTITANTGFFSSVYSGAAIAVDVVDNVYHAGVFLLRTDFDPGANQHSITPAGSEDAYFHKLSQGALVGPKIITQPTDQNFCIGTNVVFTVQAINATAYQWQVYTGSDWADINNNTLYSGANTDNLYISKATSEMNGDIYRCRISNDCCVMFSEPASMVEATSLQPSITIASTTAEICSGSPVSFTATAGNAGGTPSFQWKKNGQNVGVNSNAYSDKDLKQGDLISCTIMVNNGCGTEETAQSNSIEIKVNPTVVPAVSITSSANNICSGIEVTFTAIGINEGDNPVYHWIKNGVHVGTNAPVYKDDTLKEGDVIQCTLASSLTCVTSSSVVSNVITMNILQTTPPSLVVQASATAVCVGTPVTFTAIAVNPGVEPVYQWTKNNVPVGENKDRYIDSSLQSIDIVRCILTVKTNCSESISTISNPVQVTINLAPQVSINKNNSLCIGSTRILDAGTFSSYLWNDNSRNRTITISKLGRYYVTVTDSRGCVGSDTTEVNTWLPVPSAFLPPDTAICKFENLLLQPLENFKNYQWNTNSNKREISITQPGIYWLQVTDYNNCTGRDTVFVVEKHCQNRVFVPTAFTPNADGKNDVFKPVLTGAVKQFRLQIYNRWGEVVFIATEQNKGWDGKVKGVLQHSGVYVWKCTYQFEGETQKVKKGNLVLLQ